MSAVPGGLGLTRLQHLVLWVADVERSVGFYRDVLGFEVTRRYPGAVFLKIPGSADDHHLGLFEQPGVGRPHEGAARMYHAAWEVAALTDLARARRRLAAAGALVGASDHGSSLSLYARDPDGLELEIFWTVPGGAPVGTRPLDLDGELARRGLAMPWASWPRAGREEGGMTEEEARIRGYLEAQGAKLAPAAVVEKVQAAMAEVRAAAGAVPPARFGERPAPGEWSANEVMAHVVAAGVHFGRAIVSVLDDRPPPSRAADGGVEGAPLRSAQEWCDALARDRAALFARVLAADPAARPERTIEHGMFGSLNWRETLLFLRLHDLDHAGQLRKIAAALD